MATTALTGARSEVALVPQGGLGPGLLCVPGADMASRFDTLKTATMRVRAPPLSPTSARRHAVTWSVA